MQNPNKTTRYVVLDTETTGLDPDTGDRLVEIGCVELDEYRKPTGRIFHEYVDPEREVPEGARRVHGNTREMLIELGGGQKFKDIAKPLFEFLNGAEIIIHNAAFDVKFLNHEFAQCGIPKLDEFSSVFCTYKYALVKFPGKRVSLDALCRRFGIDNSSRELHGALLDSDLLAEVFLAMTREQKVLDLNVHTKPQDIQKLVEKMPTIVSLPVLAAAEIEEDEHNKFMARIAKESGGNSLWR